MMVGWGGNNGSTVTASILANKNNISWRSKRGVHHPNYFGSVTQASTVKLGVDAEGNDVYIPFSKVLPMVEPNDLVLGGWDISSKNLGEAMERAQVLEYDLQRQVRSEMDKLTPLPSIYYPDFIAANQSDRADNLMAGDDKQAHLEQIRKDIRDFKAANELDKVIVIWTANTERYAEVREKGFIMWRKYHTPSQQPPMTDLLFFFHRSSKASMILPITFWLLSRLPTKKFLLLPSLLLLVFKSMFPSSTVLLKTPLFLACWNSLNVKRPTLVVTISSLVKPSSSLPLLISWSMLVSSLLVSPLTTTWVTMTERTCLPTSNSAPRRSPSPLLSTTWWLPTRSCMLKTSIPTTLLSSSTCLASVTPSVPWTSMNATSLWVAVKASLSTTFARTLCSPLLSSLILLLSLNS